MNFTITNNKININKININKINNIVIFIKNRADGSTFWPTQRTTGNGSA